MSSSEVKVGAFALGSAAVLAGIITFMGAFSFGKSGYQLNINYPSVNGLMQGHVVRYAGVQVGTVKEIKVEKDKVAVVVEINDDIKIPQGAAFSIGADGIMGEKFVNVTPPHKFGNGYIAEGATINGASGGGMDEFFANSGDLLKRLENIAVAFENIFGDKEVQSAMRSGFKSMGGVMDNMNTFTKVMADVAVENQQQLNEMVKNMNELSRRMNNTVHHLESIMANVDNNGQTGRNVAAMAQNMAETSQRIENIVAALETVAQDPETTKSIKETLHNVRDTSASAKKILGAVSDAEFSADVGSSMKGSDWRSNLGVTLKPTESDYIYMGGYDIGEKNRFDFIAGKSFGAAGLSAGSMQGDFGVGLDLNFGPSFKVYSQVYDFDDTKVRVGGELKLKDSLSLYGETMDVKGDKTDTYVGVRSRF